MRQLLLVLLLLAFVFPVTAQDAVIELEPYTDTVYGFESVRPVAWEGIGNGLYQRNATQADVTLLAQQAAPVSAELLWPQVLPQLVLEEIPPVVTTYTGALTWDVYQVDVPFGDDVIRVDLALAAVEGKTYIVLFQADAADYDTLHDAIFWPALDALTPVVEDISALDYVVEFVTFENEAAGVTLAGTLTLPDSPGPHPVVVLVSGSGAQDRDEPIGSMKPFRLIADALTPAGVAVLRYDDRGVGESTGDFAAATTFDFAEDAAAAIDYLLTREDIDPAQIGVLGHSEGGIVASILGAENEHLAFIISMAGPAVSGRDLLMRQNELIFSTAEAPEEALALQLEMLPAMMVAVDASDLEAFQTIIGDTAKAQIALMTPEEQAEYGDIEAYTQRIVDQQTAAYFNDWFREFVNFNPAVAWAETTVPVLAIFAGKDVQVEAAQNIPPLEAALTEAGNTDFTIVTLPDANHLFQAAGTGSIEEYGTLAPEFTPDFLPTIIDWLQEHLTFPQA